MNPACKFFLRTCLAVCLTLPAVSALAQAPTITNLVTVYSFSGTDGAAPQAALVQGTDGNYYGTTGAGGANNKGTIFQLTPNGALKTLYAYSSAGTGDGAYPYSGLTQGSNGTFYGVSYAGGVNYAGAVFNISTSGSYNLLNSFAFSGTLGSTPYGTLVQGSDGNYYGTTNSGLTGNNNFGTIFEAVPNGNLLTVGTFNGTNGGNPYAGMILGGDGNFYGTTTVGGTGEQGTVFQFALSGAMKTLYSFSGTDGANPYGGVVQGNDGNFYGTTKSGGNSSDGTVFQLTPAGTLTTLGTFAGTNGSTPYASLLQGSDGNFYGTAKSGGSGSDGTVFEVTSSGSLTTIYNFTGPDGLAPVSALIQGSNGDYYGTTSGGGGSSLGTIFEMAPSVAVTGTTRGFNYQILATNAPSSYGATGLPGGLGINTSTGLISGTATGTGTFTVPISATNGTGTGNGTMTIIVLPVPAITSPSSVSGTNGLALSYQITAANNPTSYAASGLPAGIAINASTGLISGVPKVTGTFNASLSASNPGGAGTAALTIAVVSPATPAITSGTSVSGTEVAAFSYQLAATNNPTSYSASGLPPGVSLNTATGLISGTIMTSGTFSVAVGAANAGSTASGTLAINVPAIPVTAFYYYGAGYISQGNSQLIVSGTGGSAFSLALNFDNGVNVSAASGGSVDFSAPGNVALQTGTYVNALEYPSQGASAGLDWSANGRSNNTLTGNFAVVNIQTGQYGADFTQYDNGGAGQWNIGSIRYNSLVPLTVPPPPAFSGFAATSNDMSAVLSGTLNPNGPPATFTIAYGTDTTYGNTIPGQVISSSTTGVAASGTITGLQPNTTYHYQLIASTNVGTTASADGTFATTSIPAVFTSSLTATGTINTAFSYQAQATNSPTVWAATSLPTGLTINSTTGVITGTLTIQGSYFATITASNSGGTTTQQISLSLLPMAPQITSVTSVSGTDGATFSFTVTSINGASSYGASGLPAGLSMNAGNGVISGTPSVSGIFNATVSASNAGGTGTGPLAINLASLPVPSINSALSVTGTDGLPFTYQITALYVPITGYSAANLPAGLSVNTATGLISGTPSVTGTFTSSIGAINATGTGSASLTIAALSPPLPVITQISTLSSFTGISGTAPGANPQGTLVRGNDGNFYGTTSSGGSKDEGTIYKVSPSGSFASLFSFSGSNGSIPRCALTLGTDGNFYGTASNGGTDEVGIAFKMTSSGSFTMLNTFTGSNGAYPNLGVIQASDGNFYGTCQLGGTNNKGNVFKMTSSGSLTTLVSFNGANGSQPFAGVIQGSDGNFYGTTEYGGSGSYGSAFKMTSSGSVTQLATFNGYDGDNPLANLVQGADGNFYGTTPAGGAAFEGDNAGFGAVYRLTPSGTLTAIYASFNTPNTPDGGLAAGTDGNFYGAFYSAGHYGDGAIYNMNPVTSGNVLVAFNGSDGANAYSGLLRSGDGNSFYGTTYAGGSSGYGTIYQYFPPNVVTVEGEPFSYPIIATSITSLTYSATGLPPGISVNASTGVISGTATASGTYNATISAINIGGTTNGSLNITVVSGAPSITSGPTAQAGQNVPFSYQIAASNIPTSYSATGLPPGLVINPITGLIEGTLSGTGTYNVTVTANNAGGPGSETVTISVVTQPSITSSLNTSGTQSSPFSYQIAASNSPYGYGASGLPAGLSADPVAGMISGTPTGTGTFSVVLSATNAAGPGNATMTLVLQPAAGVPALPLWALVALPFLLLFAGSLYYRRGALLCKQPEQ